MRLCRNRLAFTMIEIVFVIVILGILAAVAIPKFAATRTDAQIAKGRADISSIRSAIVSERQTRIIRGSSSYIPNGTDTYTYDGTTYKKMDKDGLFGGVLMYPMSNESGKAGKWSATAGSGTYVFKVADTDVTFTYTPADGKFLCTQTDAYCPELTN